MSAITSQAAAAGRNNLPQQLMWNAVPLPRQPYVLLGYFACCSCTFPLNMQCCMLPGNCPHLCPALVLQKLQCSRLQHRQQLHVDSSSILVREDTNHAICWLQLAWHAAQHATRWVRTAGTATAECFTSLPVFSAGMQTALKSTCFLVCLCVQAAGVCCASMVCSSCTSQQADLACSAVNPPRSQTCPCQLPDPISALQTLGVCV